MNQSSCPQVEFRGQCYRLPLSVFIFGVACAFGAVSFFYLAITAYWSIDGSIPHRKLGIMFTGIQTVAFACGAAGSILYYFRTRLYLDTVAITRRGCLRTTTIDVSEVVRIVWRRFPMCVVIRTHTKKITVGFSEFKSFNHGEMIAFFRGTFPAELQQGWPEFAEWIDRMHWK